MISRSRRWIALAIGREPICGRRFDRIEKGRLIRIVTLEEHFLIPSLVESIDSFARNVGWMTPELRDGLTNLGERRLQAMDESGITVQVLLATVPGAELLDGVRFASGSLSAANSAMPFSSRMQLI